MAKFNTPEERAALLEDYKTSGLTIAAFCRRRGVGYSTMFRWMRDAGLPVQQKQKGGGPAAETPRFVEVEMEGCENGAAVHSPPRPPKRPVRPAPALRAELLLPGGVVLRVYHNSSSTGGEGGAA
jgi:transposase-like protein